MQNKDQAIQCLTEHLGDLETKRTRLVQDIDKEIEHIRAAIASLSASVERLQLSEVLPLVAEFPINKIRNMTQVQALVTIARHQGGVIRAQEAKRLLIRASVMKQTKNSTNIIHSVIIRSEDPRRLGRGRSA